MLFAVWADEIHRPTRDVDLLGFGSTESADILKIFRTVCAIPVTPDGINFSDTSVQVEPIREEARYGGVRVQLEARLAGARIPVQVDIGFGDAVTPEPETVTFPALLDFAAPVLRAYPIYSVVAEKTEAMVALGEVNTRMKDFYDLRFLAARYEFDGRLLVEALQATFKRRVTPWPVDVPVNVVAAAFRHTASRALDPQVHTHLVTANATWDAQSKSWRAMTEFEMLRAVRYAGKVFQNELGRSCRELGYGLVETQDERGTVTGFEITGVSAKIRERFSKRRADIELGIENFRQHHGRTPTTADIHAITVASRDVKLKEATTPAVLAAQRGQLSDSEWAQLTELKVDAERQSLVRSALEPPRERESLRLVNRVAAVRTPVAD
jgi:hypothetical protein